MSVAQARDPDHWLQHVKYAKLWQLCDHWSVRPPGAPAFFPFFLTKNRGAGT